MVFLIFLISLAVNKMHILILQLIFELLNFLRRFFAGDGGGSASCRRRNDG